MSSKAPSRQSHACQVCGKVYSRSEYVRRHYLAKHAPKLKCPECDSTFTRQDLLIRHVKIFHPSRETPSPSELAEQLDAPPPIPVSHHQNSMDSTSSFNSQASTSTTTSFLGGPLTGSPELMARSFAAELPVPPIGTRDSQAGPVRRTATYPLPLSSLGVPAVPYTPYPLPNFTSLPPSSYQSPVASPSTSSFLQHPYAGVPYPSSAGSIRGRSQTLPAPLSFFGSQAAAASAANGSFSASPEQMQRGAFVNAQVQTELLAQQIPLHFAPSPYPPLAQYAAPNPLPPSQPSYYASPDSQVPQHLPSASTSHSHHPLPQTHFSPPPLPQPTQPLPPQQQQQQQQQRPVQSSTDTRSAAAADLESFLRLQPEPSPFALDDYNPFVGFGANSGASNGVGGLGSPGRPT